MKNVIVLLAGASLLACGKGTERAAAPEGAEVVEAAVTFDGADYGDDEAAKIAHGERLSKVLLCQGCHTPELTGIDMGEFEEPLAGITASNLTLAVPNFDDAQLEHFLRTGEHPTREPIWMMPSQIYQHLADADMAALIAYLRTLEPKGEALPLIELNEGLAAAAEAGEFKPIPEMVAEHAATTPADLGAEHAQGRYIGMTVCAECHGAGLADAEGVDLTAMAPMYGREGLTRLLTTGEGLEGRELGLMAFIGGELASQLTESERAALIDYLLAHAEAKNSE